MSAKPALRSAKKVAAARTSRMATAQSTAWVCSDDRWACVHHVGDGRMPFTLIKDQTALCYTVKKPQSFSIACRIPKRFIPLCGAHRSLLEAERAASILAIPACRTNCPEVAGRLALLLTCFFRRMGSGKRDYSRPRCGRRPSARRVASAATRATSDRACGIVPPAGVRDLAARRAHGRHDVGS